jgi:hypothetical protein
MEITVGELIDMLKNHRRDAVLYFGGLDFYRVKQRGEMLVQIEFNQLVYKDRDTGRVVVENPEA